MSGRVGPVFGSLVFFWIAPGTLAGWIPYLLSRWHVQPPLFGLPAARLVGAAVVGMGVAALAECFGRFALKGRGTPAPIAPTKELVVSGLYRHVRNPMYVAVLSIILGQGLLFGSVVLLEYAAAIWLIFHVFVLAYEEPTLQRQFGASYEVYRSSVGRWWPRLTSWRGRSDD